MRGTHRKAYLQVLFPVHSNTQLPAATTAAGTPPASLPLPSYTSDPTAYICGRFTFDSSVHLHEAPDHRLSVVSLPDLDFGREVAIRRLRVHQEHGHAGL